MPRIFKTLTKWTSRRLSSSGFSVPEVLIFSVAILVAVSATSTSVQFWAKKNRSQRQREEVRAIVQEALSNLKQVVSTRGGLYEFVRRANNDFLHSDSVLNTDFNTAAVFSAAFGSSQNRLINMGSANLNLSFLVTLKKYQPNTLVLADAVLGTDKLSSLALMEIKATADYRPPNQEVILYETTLAIGL